MVFFLYIGVLPGTCVYMAVYRKLVILHIVQKALSNKRQFGSTKDPEKARELSAIESWFCNMGFLSSDITDLLRLCRWICRGGVIASSLVVCGGAELFFCLVLGSSRFIIFGIVLF